MTPSSRTASRAAPRPGRCARAPTSRPSCTWSPSSRSALAAKDLNGPSMAQGQVTSATSFTRTFTSAMKGTWTVSIDVPGFDATSSASTLTAKRVGDIESLTFDFTRTTAPLGEFTKGWVTLSGPTRVRMPVALRPVSVKAPATVEGTGTTGQVTVPITAGFTGDLPVAGRLNATQAAHIEPVAGARAEPNLLYASPSQTNLDRNTVDMDRERANFADNAVKYEATLRFINGQVRTMLSAITGQ